MKKILTANEAEKKISDLQRKGKGVVMIFGPFLMLHAGYLESLKKARKLGDFLILGLYPQKEIDKIKLEKDIRTLGDKDRLLIFSALDQVNYLFLARRAEILKIIKKSQPIRVFLVQEDFKPEEELEEVVSRYTGKLKIVKPFLRHRFVYETVKDDKKSSISAQERQFMRKAHLIAENSRCWWRQVGGLIIKGDKIILEGYNQMLPGENNCYERGCIRDDLKPGEKVEFCSVIHTENRLISQAAQKGISLEGTELYITHFPCPVCAKSIAYSGIKKLFYTRGASVFDGLEVLKSAGVKIQRIIL